MSDFRLMVGLDVVPSYKEIQADIKAIIRLINKNPPKIKIDVDPSSIKNIQKQIKDITRVASKGMSQDISKIIASATADAMKGNIVKDAALGMTATKTASTKTLTKDTREYALALAKVNNLLRQSKASRAQWTAAGGGKSDEFYKNNLQNVKALAKLKKELLTGSMDKKDFSKAFGDIEAKSKANFSEMKLQNEDTKRLTKSTQEYHLALSRLNKLILDSTNNEKKWSAAKDGKSKEFFNDYHNKIRAAKRLKQDLLTEGLNKKQFDERFGGLSSGLSSDASEIKIRQEDTKLLVKGTAEYADAIAKADAVIGEGRKRLHDWSMAKDGRSRNDYNDIKKEIKRAYAIKEAVLSGTAEEVKTKKDLAEVTKRAAQTKSSITKANENTISPYANRAKTMEQINNALAENYKTQKKMKETGFSDAIANEVDKYAAQAERLETLQKKFNEEKIAAKNVMSEFDDIKQTMKTSKSAYDSFISKQALDGSGKQVEYFKKGTEEFNSVLTRVENVIKNGNKGVEGSSLAKVGESIKSFSELESTVQQAKTIEDRMLSGQAEKSQTLKDVKALETNLKLANSVISKNKENFIDPYQDKEKTITTFNKAIAESYKVQKKYSEAISIPEISGVFDTYKSAGKTIEELKSKFEQGILPAKELNEQFANATTTMKKNESELNAYFSKADSKKNFFKSQEDAISKISAKYSESQKKLSEYTMAKNGKSKSSYEDYGLRSNELRSLIDLAKEGNIELGELGSKYRNIVSIMNKDEFAIVDAKENVMSPLDEYAKNLTKIEKLKATYREVLTNFTAAKEGTTSDTYNHFKSLGSVLDDVETKFKNNAISAKDLTSELSNLDDAMNADVLVMKNADEAKKSFADMKDENIRNVEKLIQLTREGLTGWTAAKNTKDYSNLREALPVLSSLRDGLIDGSVSAEKFQKTYSYMSDTVDKSSRNIRSAGLDTRSFGDRIGSLSKRLTAWFGVSRIIMVATRTMKQMVTESMKVEDSMAQLKIVTGASDKQMETFLSKSTTLAQELGKSITDVSSSVETFSRLGYNLTDSSDLAKYANILSNVANVETDVATTGLTSIIKGYNMDPSQAEHVSDVLVKVGQEYAISAEELMAAFQRGGAALYASGTDFEKSAALFAATNASLQNAESVGEHICPAA